MYKDSINTNCCVKAFKAYMQNCAIINPSASVATMPEPIEGMRVMQPL